MFRKDFLQRQFEAFGKVLASLLQRRKEKDYNNFEKEIETASKDFAENYLSFYEALSDQDFLNLVILAKGLSFEQKKILATLLFEKMNFYEETGLADKFSQTGKRCLALYRHLNEFQGEGAFDLDVHYKLSVLSKFN